MENNSTNYFQEYVTFLTEQIRKNNIYIQEFCDLYLDFKNNIELKNLFDDTAKNKNVTYIFTNIMFLLEELIDNIILRNLSASLSIQRSIIENFFIFKFLEMSDTYTNEIFYDYNSVKYINLILEHKKEKFEKKYKVKYNKNGDQWIDIVNKHNKYHGKCKGFSSIMNQVGYKEKEYKWLYKFSCNFIHISISGTDFNISRTLKYDEYKEIFINICNFGVSILGELLQDDYIISQGNEYIISNFNKKLDAYKSNVLNFDKGEKDMNFHKVKCKHCNKILSDNIKKFQICYCGKVQMDSESHECVRLLGNPKDYEILE